MIRKTRQRDEILKNLQSRRDHPTADMVYESVRQVCPNLSLGTVYRNLALLTEEGRILKITTGQGADHFDGFVHPHHHFVCKQCGSVLDMEFDVDQDLLQQATEGFTGRIEEYQLQFFGKCASCK